MRNFTGTSGCLISVLFLMLMPATLTAQTDPGNIKFENISIKDGLSQSSPNCILQDAKGLLWIGTEDGLNRYDGYNFHVFKPDPNDTLSISHSRILSLFEDRSGNLWIGTNGGGLNKLDRRTENFQLYSPEGNEDYRIPGNIVRCIVRAAENELWIGTDMGLAIIDEATGASVDIESDRSGLSAFRHAGIRAMTSDIDGYVWIATETELYRFNPVSGDVLSSIAGITTAQPFSSNPVNALLADHNGNLWIATETGLANIIAGNGTIEPAELPSQSGNDQADFPVRALYEDENGRLWIGTFGEGLYIFQPETGRIIQYTYQYTNPYSLSNNEILSIYEDHSGIIWIGSNGLDRYNPRKEKFILYDYVPYVNENLIFRNIHPIYQDNNDVLWIGSKGDGLHILDRNNQSYSRMVHENGIGNSLPSNRIRAILEEPENVLWIGTDDQGLCKIILDENRQAVRTVTYLHDNSDASSLSGNTVYDLLSDGNGQLWIGTNNGLSVMNMETEVIKRYQPDDADPSSLSHTTAYSIYIDRDGIIWIATDLGINRYDGNRDGFIRYVHNDLDTTSLIHNEILTFHEDGEGHLWIGTYGYGIDRFDKSEGTFRHYSHIAELSRAVVYGILEDDLGSFWLSTNNGIMHFDPETEQVKVFRVEDGLQSNEFNGTSYFRSTSGEMFFGGQYGFNSFYPEDVILDSIPPRIVLSDLLVNNVSVTPGEDSPINVQIGEASEIELSYKENNFTLYFSALHFANPSLNQYKYMLEGFDDDWVEAGTKRFVTYTSLPYRNYRFRVLAANSDGVWNEEGLAVMIRVRPPFWSTLWFRILMALTLAVLAYYIYRKRMQSSEKQKELLTEKYMQSDNRLQEAKDQLARQHEEIVIQKQELKLRERDQQELLWFNQGISMFSEIITKQRGNMQELCRTVISRLVDFLDAQQGAIFLINDDDGNEPWLELMASFGFDGQKSGKQYQPGEGYVGCCFTEKNIIEVDNLSDGYATLHSGLGKRVLRHLLLAPLKIGETCIGVIELASFRKLKGFKVSFMEKMTETLASNIHTERANAKMKTIIEDSIRQAGDLRERESQLQMQLEENKAMQEESDLRERALKKDLEDFQQKEAELNQRMEILQCRLAALQPNDSKTLEGK